MTDEFREYKGVVQGIMGRLHPVKVRASDYASAAEVAALEWMEGGLASTDTYSTTDVSVFIVDTDGTVKPCRVTVHIRVSADVVDTDAPVPDDVTCMLTQP